MGAQALLLHRGGANPNKVEEESVHDLLLLSIYQEDLVAFEHVLEGRATKTILLRSLEQLKRDLGQLQERTLLLCSMGVNGPHLKKLLNWMQKQPNFSTCRMLFILDADPTDALTGYPMPHNVHCLHRPVKQNVLLRAIEEQQDELMASWIASSPSLSVDELPVEPQFNPSPAQPAQKHPPTSTRPLVPPPQTHVEKPTPPAPQHVSSSHKRSESLTPLPPPKIRAVTIKREIGRGGAGVVYLGHQDILERDVAVKLLLPDRDFNITDGERLKREARSIARLKHENIVHCHDAGFLADGSFYLVMEFLDGTNLESFLAKARACPEEQAAYIVLQVARGLQYAHERGLIHRDIKPSNLIMSQDDHVTITDFGLALHGAEGERMTQAGVVVGTPHYLAPEQAYGQAITPAVDVYGLGIVFYELLTGKLPVAQENPFQAVMERLRKHHCDPSRHKPDLSPELVSLVTRMTKTKVDERITSCAQVIDELERFLGVPQHPFSESRTNPGAFRSAFGDWEEKTKQENSSPNWPSPKPNRFTSSSEWYEPYQPDSQSQMFKAPANQPSQPAASQSQSFRASESQSFRASESQSFMPPSRREHSPLFSDSSSPEMGLARALEQALRDKSKVSQAQRQQELRKSTGTFSPLSASQTMPKANGATSGAWRIDTNKSSGQLPPKQTPLPTQTDEFDQALRQAKRSYLSRNYTEALGYFEKCAQLRPDDKSVRSNIAKLKERIGSI